MKQFRWILLSGLLVAATSVAQAQAPSGSFPSASSGSSAIGGSGSSAVGGNNGGAEVGSISNAPGATTTTTTTTGIAPDSSFLPAEDGALGAESDSSLPDTGGEPMIAVLAGLSIAGAAVAMRRKVTA